MSGDPPAAAPIGLHVVYGSRTRRGLNHANEDRHAVAAWRDWRIDAHLQNADKPAEEQTVDVNDDWPKAQVTVPLCTGSARKDTTVSGSGGTGQVIDTFESRWDTGNTNGSREGSLSRGLGNGLTAEQAAYLWTVCDGHDGPEAANFICRKIGETFSRIWHSPHSNNLPANFLQMKKLSSGDESDVYARGYALSNALARTFEALDASFKLVVTEGGQLESCTAGSCVTSIFLTGNLMCCAGLGDCKAAILTLEEGEPNPASSKSGDASTTAEDSRTASGNASKATQQFQVTWFSKEHRSSSPKERARIRARGGWFRHGRVGGVLEPTRTIGDFDVKASQPPGVVIATPEVRTFTVTKPALVLVASDGVWDVMDASQLLRTLKKRRRLWRGILSWLGAPMPERRSLMNFGFRRRAKSKEGLESMLQMPTGGDLCAMADTLVTRAHDLGSDDDCTCVVLYLRPVAASRAESSKRTTEEGDILPGEADQDLNASQTLHAGGEAAEEDDDDDEDLEEEEELEEDDADKLEAGAEQYSPSADSFSEYEKWRNPAGPSPDEVPGSEDEDGQNAAGADASNASKEENVWDLSTATFPVSLVATSQGMEALFPSSTVDVQDAPEVIEKARKRREERRAARERRKRSLEEKALMAPSRRTDQADEDEDSNHRLA